MQTFPLVVTHCLDHAARWHGATPVVCSHSGRSSWAAVRQRALALAGALERDLGVQRGERVATMAFNSLAHLEVRWSRECPGDARESGDAAAASGPS